jgi:selenocysteine lyase/cysteine desulfurase
VTTAEAEARRLTLRAQFLLRPDMVFLNHGSFGACPRPVFETYQNWQRELEHQPVEFLGRCFNDLLRTARAALASYLGAHADEFAVEVPIVTWRERPFIRVSIQGYNTRADVLQLLAALGALLPRSGARHLAGDGHLRPCV